MNSAKTTTTVRTITMSRRGFALAAALVLGMSTVPSVDAAKKGRTTIESINKRVRGQKDLCEIIGFGILTSEKVGKATVTQCTGGTSHGKRCVHTKKSTKCHQTQTVPSGEDPADPPPGEPPPGATAVDPGAPPTEVPGEPPADEPFLL